MPLNKEKIQALLGQFKNAMGGLETYRNEALGTLLSNEEKLGNIKYRFITATFAPRRDEASF